MTIRVLMVDDEARFRETTRRILAGKGFETILAENGEQAVEKLGLAPHVVILDIRMPGMDGHEVLARIRRDHPDLPVIMLTGHGDKASAEQALAQGASDYLAKPCDIDLLADRIRTVCQERVPGKAPGEPRVGDVMIPISAYTTIEASRTVGEAVSALKASFTSLTATRQLMEAGHRSVLVMGEGGRVMGILTIRDMLEVILPGYLTSPKPSTADAIQYSPLFWTGMFAAGIREIRSRSISEVMSPSPAAVDSSASLMEAAYLMISENQPRLIVEENGRPAGVIREQDLFFEMDNVLKAK